MEARVIAPRAIVVAALCASGCGRPAGPSPSNGGPVNNSGGDPSVATLRNIDDVAGATAAVGARVQVKGTAQNDKLSAVIEARAVTVYCLDLQGWPADQVGKPAAIEGTLERTDQFAARPSDGLASQGTTGSLFVIRRCTVAH